MRTRFHYHLSSFVSIIQSATLFSPLILEIISPSIYNIIYYNFAIGRYILQLWFPQSFSLFGSVLVEIEKS